MKKVVKPEAEWKEQLSPNQFWIMREKGTEPAFSGEYYATKDSGTYLCAACGTELFSSATKYDSGTGWPSFYAPISKENVAEDADFNYGMHRVEVLCGICDSHLGHVFPDGPPPTGLRYCINSASLELDRQEGKQE